MPLAIPATPKRCRGIVARGVFVSRLTEFRVRRKPSHPSARAEPRAAPTRPAPGTPAEPSSLYLLARRNAQGKGPGEPRPFVATPGAFSTRYRALTVLRASPSELSRSGHETPGRRTRRTVSRPTSNAGRLERFARPPAAAGAQHNLAGPRPGEPNAPPRCQEEEPVASDPRPDLDAARRALERRPGITLEHRAGFPRASRRTSPAPPSRPRSPNRGSSP